MLPAILVDRPCATSLLRTPVILPRQATASVAVEFVTQNSYSKHKSADRIPA
ncbi:Uncharacterised protein [Mycobacteroides abscessus subsp. abscessus]|nr:Uncharacterised protein [Mycobacteroides abscessus subsp. abscessus]